MMTKEAKEKIIEKLVYLIDGINGRSSREEDLKISQAVQMLSEAYKNIKEAG